ncbi:MAG: helix-turn-helix domain-containing protein [Eubacterium sp.]|jgi:transposase-like protein|nr:helix-turn-helix domain-containing protein [Eubacterium sp.]MCH3954049.1 helix-turn-helix domain-containing protein [Eubacterium sp.]MCH3954459.1 helix-turn-helix domain-containing protein [Eubacterium sp.]MCH3955651.1 helix-turn-helix domain-containing protein [Eubacterium sp.]MCH4005593.1 helix-turn-helix domain-containing protein [Eubacterium sp.]
MGRRGKRISEEIKLKYARQIFEGRMTRKEAARELGIDSRSVSEWVLRYREQGEIDFLDTGHNRVYPLELKLKAVNSYLNGEGSQREISARYGLRARTQLHKWIKMYNNGIDFTRKMSGGSRMTTSRKTSKNERVKIARECLANGKNYGETAMKYGVSYQQVYTWVKRYLELGEAGLEDRRGRRKADQQPRSEIEELKIKLAQTEYELYMTKMERDLLKKVRELERKENFRK